MIWTQVADLISYYDNRYTQLTSYAYKCIKFSWVQHKIYMWGIQWVSNSL